MEIVIKEQGTEYNPLVHSANIGQNANAALTVEKLNHKASFSNPSVSESKLKVKETNPINAIGWDFMLLLFVVRFTAESSKSNFQG